MKETIRGAKEEGRMWLFGRSDRERRSRMWQFFYGDLGIWPHVAVFFESVRCGPHVAFFFNRWEMRSRMWHFSLYLIQREPQVAQFFLLYAHMRRVGAG